jgi:hypothetical protein
MPVSRVAIERALDGIASDEGGMRFQGLAVVLAKLRWPELIACERKKDLGLDAHAPAILSPLHKGMGLSSSITPELEKIQGDCQGRSKSRPLGRSKRLPAEGTINRDLRGCRAS